MKETTINIEKLIKEYQQKKSIIERKIIDQRAKVQHEKKNADELGVGRLDYADYVYEYRDLRSLEAQEQLITQFLADLGAE